MDTSEDINTVEWFFGYGGNHLGLKRVLPNLRLLAACEIEEFAVENILAKMEAGLLEAAPIWSDCKTFPWEPFVDRTHLFVASYPCQPFSAAGKRQGADDERHLWPYVHRWILRARPLLVFLENVEGHISLGLSTVISDLEEAGYKTAWGIFSASEVGAPHQRKRVFILAYRISEGSQGCLRSIHLGLQGEAQSLRSVRASSVCYGQLADCASHRLNGSLLDGEAFEQAEGNAIARGCAWPSRPGEQQFWWEPPRVVGDARHNAGSDERPRCADFGGAHAGRHIDQHPQPQVEERRSGREIEGQWSCAGEPSDGAGATDLLADTASAGSGSEGGDAVHQGWSSSDTWAASVSQDAERQAGAAIADDQPAGGDGGELGDATSTRCPRPEDAGADCCDAGQWPRREESERASDLADAKRELRPRRPQRTGRWIGQSGETQCDVTGSGGQGDGLRQTQPSLGRDADGPADWLDDAELFATCDNRTDELRLLGNGVVPATAERAFRTLVSELMEYANQ